MLLYAFTLKTSATAIIAKNAASYHKISVFFGRYFGSSKANRIHDANIISIIILKAKFFPVMNGKSKSGKKKPAKDSPPATITGIKRIKNKTDIPILISIIILKAKFFPVMNGKSKSGKKKAVKDSPPATITGIKGIKNKPDIVNILKNFAIKIFFYCSRNELEDLEFGR